MTKYLCNLEIDSNLLLFFKFCYYILLFSININIDTKNATILELSSIDFSFCGLHFNILSTRLIFFSIPLTQPKRWSTYDVISYNFLFFINNVNIDLIFKLWKTCISTELGFNLFCLSLCLNFREFIENLVYDTFSNRWHNKHSTNICVVLKFSIYLK